MHTPPDSLPAPDLAALTAALGPLAPAFAIRWVEDCTSTNSVLLNAPPDEDGRAHVLVATRQSAGRGRRGRQWLAWPGASLTFSMLWRLAPGAPPAGLSLVVGLALARALEKLGVAGVALKWPNDTLVHGAKIAGVLVELSGLSGRGGATAVIGIGLNLHLPADANIPGQTGGVTDLARALGATPAREVVLAALLTELHATLTTYASAGFGLLRGAWQQRNAFADLPVRVSGEGLDVVGLCVGVDEDGALLVRSSEGVRRILAGEISLRPAS
jgi:BirA family biotin operon repressor/biotin-[acetyl-CoA-carboxylase] ligase